ncbi:MULTISPECIES: hypothetical protein [Xanthomonas]|nr:MULTISPECIES: hypothetical protein [Xanthomonas]
MSALLATHRLAAIGTIRVRPAAAASMEARVQSSVCRIGARGA